MQPPSASVCGTVYSGRRIEFLCSWQCAYACRQFGLKSDPMASRRGSGLGTHRIIFQRCLWKNGNGGDAALCQALQILNDSAQSCSSAATCILQCSVVQKCLWRSEKAFVASVRSCLLPTSLWHRQNCCSYRQEWVWCLSTSSNCRIRFSNVISTLSKDTERCRAHPLWKLASRHENSGRLLGSVVQLHC